MRGAAAVERKSVGRPSRVTAQPRRSVDRENRLTVSLKPLSDRVVTHGRNWVSQQRVVVGISSWEFEHEAFQPVGGGVEGRKKGIFFVRQRGWGEELRYKILLRISVGNLFSYTQCCGFGMFIPDPIKATKERSEKKLLSYLFL